MASINFLSCTSKMYPGGWSVISEDKFDAETTKNVERAFTVDSEYGVSICFVMNTGERCYMPCSEKNESHVAGESVDIQEVTVLTLSRAGSSNIFRASFTPKTEK